MRKTFNVRKDANAQEHQVSITIPSFEAMNDAQRRRMVEKGVQSAIIDVQGGLRRDLKSNGTLRGQALEARAQARFDAILNERPAQQSTIIDCRKVIIEPLGDMAADLENNEPIRKMIRAQVDALTASGATVVNIPEGV